MLANYVRSKHQEVLDQQLRQILQVHALPEETRILYENLFTKLAHVFSSPETSDQFLEKIYAEKLELLHSTQEYEKKKRDELISYLLAMNLTKLSLFEDTEIKSIVKKLEKKNLKQLINVLKHIYFNLSDPSFAIDHKKFNQKFDEWIKEPSIVELSNNIINNKELTEIEKSTALLEFELELIDKAQQEALIPLWSDWKQKLHLKCALWTKLTKDKTTPEQRKQIKFKQDAERKFLAKAQADYRRELKKYILIERGDYVLKKYNQDLKERIELTIQMLNKNPNVMGNASLSGFDLLKTHLEDADKWHGLEEIYDELDNSENRWKKLKLKYHPDKNYHPSASVKFGQVIEAEQIYNKLMKNRFFLQKNEEVTKKHLKAQWEYERLGDGQRRMIDIYSEMLTILEKKFHTDPKCDEWVKERQYIIQCIEKGLPILNPKFPTSMLSFEIYQSEIAESLDRLMTLAFIYTTGSPLGKMIEAPKMSTNLHHIGFGTILQTVQKEIKAGLNNTKLKKEEIEPVIQKMLAGDYDGKITTTFTDLSQIAQNINKSYEIKDIAEDKHYKMRKKGIMLAAALQKRSEEKQKFVKNIAFTEIPIMVQKINKKK